MREAIRRRHLKGRLAGRWVENGDQHWLVAPRPELLDVATAVPAVGFFGRARSDVGHGPILVLEQELLARAASFAGLLAYHNVRFAEGQWGNLVTFGGPGEGADVRTDPAHLDAVARAPHHYHSVRIHRLRLPGRPLGTGRPELESTLLIDFAESPPRRTVRATG